MRANELKALLIERGWVKDREAKGDHTIYRFPPNNSVYVVPQYFADKGRRVANCMANIKRLERK